MERIQIGFLGYGTRALDELMRHPLYEVNYFVVPVKRLCRDVYQGMERYKNHIKIRLAEDNASLAQILTDIRDVDCFLMNACPIILNQSVLDKMQVYNIHPGDLSYNRGHHPHLWTVLLGEAESKITLHKVDTGIDEGLVIKSIPVPVGRQEDASAVLDKLEDRIPELLDALYEYHLRGFPPEGRITGGGYRRKMKHSDYEIIPGKDDRETVERKIMARSMHHGAFYEKGGLRFYVDKVKKAYRHPVCSQKTEAVVIEADEAGEELFVADGKWCYFFRINKIESAGEEGHA